MRGKEGVMRMLKFVEQGVASCFPVNSMEIGDTLPPSVTA